MPQISYLVYGVVYAPNGTTLLDGIDVFVYNKTKDEIHHSSDAGFEDLKTNAQGEYQVNLASYAQEYSNGDVIYITAKNGSDTVSSRIVVSIIAGGTEQNLTMENLEPVMNLTKFLRVWTNDPLSSRNNTVTMIMPNYPRSQNLTKTSYPRISVEIIEEGSEKAGLTNNKSEIITSNFRIGAHVWAKDGDAQVLDISGDNYEGRRLLEYLTRHISDILRKRFLVKPSYDKDPHIQDFYFYKRESLEFEKFDEEEGLMHANINIQTKHIKQG